MTRTLLRAPSRRARITVLATSSLLLVTGCGGDSPIPADDAVGHYDSLVEDLTTALPGATAPWTHAEATRKAADIGGSCTYTPGTWDPETPLAPPTDDDEWNQRIDAVNPALEGHGFDRITETTTQGPRTLLRTEDEHGATLTITAEGEIRIWEASVDADPCTLAGLGTS